LQLIFIVSTDPSNNDTLLNTTDPGYQIYWRLSTATHGELIRLDHKGDVADLFIQFMRFQYDTETLFHVHRYPCPAGNDFVYEIDRDPGITNYYLHATGGRCLFAYRNPTIF
jgi:hypothetical protein